MAWLPSTHAAGAGRVPEPLVVLLRPKCLPRGGKSGVVPPEGAAENSTLAALLCPLDGPWLASGTCRQAPPQAQAHLEQVSTHKEHICAVLCHHGLTNTCSC